MVAMEAADESGLELVMEDEGSSGSKARRSPVDTLLLSIGQSLVAAAAPLEPPWRS